jgi:hypothetical protein
MRRRRKCTHRPALQCPRSCHHPEYAHLGCVRFENEVEWNVMVPFLRSVGTKKIEWNGSIMCSVEGIEE